MAGSEGLVESGNMVDLTKAAGLTEVEALRFQSAYARREQAAATLNLKRMEMERAQQMFAAQENAYLAMLANLRAKYGLGEEDTIQLDTGVFTRKPTGAPASPESPKRAHGKTAKKLKKKGGLTAVPNPEEPAKS